jgi:leucyl-tRNA synthetase
LEQILKDKGFATEEPFKKLINQGMILGTSAFVFQFITIQIEPIYLSKIYWTFQILNLITLKLKINSILDKKLSIEEISKLSLDIFTWIFHCSKMKMK